MLQKSNQFNTNTLKVLETNSNIYIFNLINFLQNGSQKANMIEISFLLIQFLQILSFPFAALFINLWRNSEGFTVISFLLESLRLIPLNISNTISYLIIFYCSVLFLIFYSVMIIYSAIALTKNHFIFLWPLKIIKQLTRIITGVLFIPLLSIFFSPFNCNSTNTLNYYTDNTQCFTGLLIAPTIFGSLCSIILIFIKVQYTLLGYDIKLNSLSFLSKFNSGNDIIFLIEQIFFALSRELLQLIIIDYIIIIYLLFTLTLAVKTYYHNQYFNPIAKQINFLQHFILLWNVISLSFGRILLSSIDFNPLVMFIVGCPVIILLSFFVENNALQVISPSNSNWSDCLYKILLYIDFIENQRSRENEIVLESFIRLTESECNHNDCALKNYLSTQKNNNNTTTTNNNQGALIYLILHADQLFNATIGKFPNVSLLRICYSDFLYYKLRKKNHAMLELLNAKSSKRTYYDNYLIYKLQNVIDPSSSSNINMNEISNALIYKLYFQQFKRLIAKVSFSYKDFWTILHTSNQKASATITKLNNVGYSISQDIESIKIHFNKLRMINNADIAALQYYVDFLEVIVHDKKQAKKYKTMLNDLEKLSKTIDNEDIVNIDPYILEQSDYIQYIIISMNNEDQPYMQNISLGLCESLGYNKHDLEGKHLDIIIPEIYRGYHSKLLKKRMNEFHTKMYENHIEKMQYKTFPSFYQNKLRYIIPIIISPGIVPNEYDEHYFIAKITIDEEFYSRNNQCYVLTDMNNMITSYSVTAIGLLDLSSNDMKNHGMSIYDNITEVSIIEPHCKKSNKSNNYNLSVSPSSMKKMKSMKSIKIAKGTNNNKYYKRNIIWEKKEKMNDGSFRFSIHSIQKGIVPQSQYPITPKLLILDTQRIMIDNEQIGSLFKFKLQKQRKKAQNNNLNYNANNNNYTTNKGNEYSMSFISESSIAIDDYNHFDKDFLPNNNDECLFLMNNGEYCMTQKGDCGLRNKMENMKNEAIDTMKRYYQNQQSNNSNSNGNSSNTSETYSSNGSDYYSSEAALSDLQSNDHLNKKNNTHQDSINNKRNTFEDDYYHVRLSHVQYSIYNFDKRTYDLQSNTIPHQSQVEEKLKTYRNQINSDSNNNDNASKTPNTEEEKLLYNKRLQMITKEKSNSLIRQLTLALSKYENHHEITILKFITAFIVLISIAESIAFYIYYQKAAYRLVSNMSLVYDSYELLLDIIVCVYLVREISLIANENYTMSYASIEDYRKQVAADIHNYFIKGELLLDSLTSTSVYFTQSNYEKLYVETIKTYSIKDDLGLQCLNMTLLSALSSAMDSLYYISLTTKESLLPSQDPAYSFIVNGLNGINEGLKAQSNIFIEELKITMDNIKNESLTLCVIYSILSIPFYFLISMTYFKVSAKKDDYTNIFFEIEDEVIEVSLLVCEEFCHKITKRKNDKQYSDVNVNNINEEEGNANPTYNDNNICNMATTNNQSTFLSDFSSTSSLSLKNSSKNHHRQNCSIEAIIVRLFLIILLSLIIIFTAIIISKSNQALDAIYFSIIVFRSEMVLQARYLTVFNVFREYVFDKSINVFYKPLEDAIESIFSTIFTMRAEEISILKQYEMFCPPEYIQLTHHLDKSNICDMEKELFPDYISDSFSCKQVTYGSGELGLPILYSFYIEEVKMMKNAYYLFEDTAKDNGFVYNSTLIGLPQYDELYPKTTDENILKKYDELHPINFFNLKKHDEIVLLFRYILLPLMIQKNLVMKNGFRASDAQFEVMYSMLLLSHGLIIVLGYLFVWRGIENRLNDTIFKTKNMLGIIPMKVLIRLQTVHKMFELNMKIDSSNSNFSSSSNNNDNSNAY